MKEKIKRLQKNILNAFKKKVPVYCPIYEGNKLKNKIALITGGSSGIGYSIAKSFILNGASVIIIGRNEKKLKKSIEELSINCQKNQFIKYYLMDISDVSNIENIIKKIVDENKIDILVNNAGIGNGDVIGKTKISDFENVIKTNLEGTYFLSQYIFNYMIDNKIEGNILNIYSSSAIRPAVTPYMLSKWSILGLTKGLAKKGIQYNIVVNGIAPGPTATPMLKNSDKDLSLNKLPAKRYVLPEEVANIATILVSDMGRMIVGDTIFITGGAGITTYDDIEY